MLKSLPALAAIAFSAALLVPTAGLAQETTSERVSYADLDLALSSGQRVLQNRIAFAAVSLCDTADEFNLAMRHEVLSCRSATIAGAQPAFRAAVAQALHPSVTVLDAAAVVVTAH